KENELIEKGDKIIVGLSGGPDSVFLLYSLIQLKNIYNLEIESVHINHMIRGDEAYRDEKFSVELARKWGIPVNVYRVRVEAFARVKKCGIEEAARELRYRIYKLEHKKKNAKLALGHTADDRIETFMFNLIRGTGIYGLRSIPKKRGFIIRPIIHIFKRDIWRFLKQKGIGFVIDSSNLSLFYTRNQIRRTLIPNLEQFNPRVKEHIYHLTELFENLEDYIDNEREFLFKQKVMFKNERVIFFEKSISEFPLIIFGELIRKSLIELGYEHKGLNFYILSKLRTAKRGIFELAKSSETRVLAEKTRKGYIISMLPLSKTEDYTSPLSNTVVLPYDLGTIKAEKISIDDIVIRHADETTGYIKFKEDSHLVRFIHKGDRFLPFSRTGDEEKLARYMLERAVPFIFRQYIPIVTIGNDIAWVGGVGISERFKLNSEDKYATKLCWKGYIADFLRRRELWRR
ncbi:MAG: tRNA lysidine(34) synthetase TilS, partial [bacterium]